MAKQIGKRRATRTWRRSRPAVGALRARTEPSGSKSQPCLGRKLWQQTTGHLPDLARAAPPDCHPAMGYGANGITFSMIEDPTRRAIRERQRRRPLRLQSEFPRLEKETSRAPQASLVGPGERRPQRHESYVHGSGKPEVSRIAHAHDKPREITKVALACEDIFSRQNATLKPPIGSFFIIKWRFK